jgi:hypothetical protein
VLLRRTRLGLLAARELSGEQHAGGSAEERGPVQRVGDVIARELGWGSERLAAEVERFAEEARAEGIAPRAPATESVAGAGASRGEAAP